MISGTGRSGTTIIKNVLSQHPDVFSFSDVESRIFSDFPTVFDLRKRSSAHEQAFLVSELIDKYQRLFHSSFLERVYAYLYRRFLARVGNYLWLPRYSGVGLSRYYPLMMVDLHEFLDTLSTISYKGFFTGSRFGSRKVMYSYSRDMLDSQIRTYLEKVIATLCKDRHAIIEDNPFGFYYSSDWNQMINENFKHFFIIRDPRDIVCSLMRCSWAPSSLQECCVYVRRLLDDAYEIVPNNDFIRLEDFIRKPKETSMLMVSSIGLDDFSFDFSMLTSASIGRYRALSGSDQEFLTKYYQHDLEKFRYI